MSFTIEDLKKKPVWVNWILFGNPANPTEPPSKKPKNPKNLFNASVNDPATWGTFEQAKTNVGKTITHRHYTAKDTFTEHQCEIAGIGFVFTDGICGIDIDNKKGKPELDRQAETVINLMDTHTERSPSETGRHIIFRCDMSKIPTINGKLDGRYYYKNPYNDLECYFAGLTNRFFTYTGDTINDKNIEDRTEQVLIFIENYMLKENFQRKNSRQERTENQQSTKTTDDIIEIARKAKNGAEFIALYDRGDISAYNSDDSAADLALCNRLAWYLQGDFNEIDSYFRQSALYRDKWERVDYRTATINKAIEKCRGKYYTPKNPIGRPKKEKEKKEYTPEQEEILKNTQNDYGVYDDEKLTISAVAFHLEQIGATVKYNETIREAEITGLDKFNNNYIVDSFPVVIYNDLNLDYKRCPKSDVQDFLKVIMMNNAYNPVLQLIEGNKWDGVDRLPELFRILRIVEDDRLSKILLYKWHWQNLSMARNDKGEYGADGLLVLRGKQGTGKTSYARKSALKNEWFGESLILDIRNKDTVINAVSCWIGEWGEIESTFKSDINALKGFITLPKDSYRVPYGRTTEKVPRRTSYIGTCNSDEYLIDETGNRRYWTIPINERIDLEALEKFDMLQLYLQIDERDARKNPQGFRLTPEENGLLDERNAKHEKPLKGESEIRDILYKAENDEISFVYEEMTATEFKLLYGSLKNYSANQIGTALRKQGLTPEIKKVNGKACNIYNLPRPKNRLNAEDFNNKL